MYNNKIELDKAKKIEFKTHTCYVAEVGVFVVVYFVINNDIYFEMELSSRSFSFGNSLKEQNQRALRGLIATSFGIAPNPEFVFKPSPIENERYLIYRFIKSIFQQHNNFYQFEDELEFFKFCDNNKLERVSQEWFKRIYFKSSLSDVISFVTKCSLEFQELYFPQDDNSSRMIPTLHDIKLKRVQYDFKSDFNAIYNILLKNEVKSLYHFTSRKNIESIKKHNALLSQKEICERGISVCYASNDISRQSDASAGLDNYVRVSFVKNHPMMHTAMTCGRIMDPVILEINPLIALMPNVLFSDRNALRNGAIIGPSSHDLAQVHFDVIKRGSYLNLPDNQRMYYQAEVLVPTRIGLEMVLNIRSF